MPIRVTIIMMKIMMKYNSIKEIVKGAHNGTQCLNSAHPKKQSCGQWWGAADQCTMSHGTLIYIMIYRNLNYTTGIYMWNQAGKNNSIISLNAPSWPHQLLVCICLLERVYFNYLVCTYDIWYAYIKWSTRAITKVFMTWVIIRIFSYWM